MVLIALIVAVGGPKLPPPQFVAGDEIVYAGTIDEASDRVDLPYRKRTAVEVRLFVLAATRGSADVAVMTSLTLQDDPAVASAVRTVVGRGPEEQVAAVRLELVRVDGRGRVRVLKPAAKLPLDLSARCPTADPPTLPTDAVAAVELGAFVPRPEEPPTADTTWDATDLRWTLVGTAVWGGAEVIELAGSRQSAEWGRQAPGKVGWKRDERAWASPADGLVRVLQRTVERADGPTPLGKVVVRYEMAGPPVPHRGDSYTAARREIEHAVALTDMAKIEKFRRDHPPGSFRPALDAVARRMEKR